MKQQTRLITIRFLLLFSVLMLIFAVPNAYTGSTENFNPNFIISDEEMQNSDSMDAEEIQAFLQEKNSFLANYITKNQNGELKLASEIIANAAKEYKINPKYLLVKLQKEQSLITDNNPDQKQLNWATGYGVCDGCTLSDADVQQHKGFSNQVNSAAGVMRWYYDNVGTKNVVKQPRITYNIDNTSVTPLNFATAFLYTYTPHLQGNKNFWKLWQKWFEQKYPDGSLLKPFNSSTVYLIREEKKHKFNNYSALTSRFNPDRIIEVPSSELARYDDGAAISLPNYAVLKNDHNYYLLDRRVLRPFASKETVRKLGYHPAEIIKVKSSEIDHYRKGDVITSGENNIRGRLLKVQGQLYYIKGSTYRPVYDKKIAQVNFPNLTVQSGSVDDFEGLSRGDPLLLKNGTLFGMEGLNKIFVVENGKRRHIKDENVFNSMGYKWKNIVRLNRFAGQIHKKGEPLIRKKQNVLAAHRQNNNNFEPKNKLAKKIIKTPKNKRKVVGPEFATPIEAYAVADYDTGKVLASKNASFARPMASFVKIMTTFELFKQGFNPRFITTYAPKRHKAKYHRYNITKGEMVRNEDLLDSFLVASFNTPGKMMVDKTTKDRESFIEQMNQRANKWGLDKTSFVDVTGERVNNKTTAKEYVKLFKKALQDDRVKKNLNEDKYLYQEILTKDASFKHFAQNTNELLKKEEGLPFSILASKTGYLHEAGANLVMLIQDKKTKERYIIVTMGNPQLENKFQEPKRLAKWSLVQF